MDRRNVLATMMIGVLILGCTACSKNNNDVEVTEESMKISEHNEAATGTAESDEENSNESQTNNELEQTEHHALAELNHTYTTQYGIINAVTCPQFVFEYSDNWTISKEEVAKGGQDTGIYENVVLTNDRGVTINYLYFRKLGGYGRNMSRYEVSKAADAQFVAGYDSGNEIDYAEVLGKFMVGRIEVTGELFMGIDDDYKVVTGKESYAVMPESYVGTHEAVGLSGYYEEFATDYGNYLFYADAPDGIFTEEEKQEVIRILSTFRLG